MKHLKHFMCLMMLLIVLIMTTGCVNSTYKVTLKNNGYMDVEFTLLYDNSALDEINSKMLEDIKNEFEKIGYKITPASELGHSGYVIKKDDIPPEGDKFIASNPYNIDLLDDVMYNTEFKDGPRTNTYKFNARIDLTSFGQIPPVLAQKITQEEYKTFLSSMNIKLVVQLEDGEILSTNSSAVSADKKSASWMLIPGAVTEVSMNARTGVNFAWIVSMIVVAVIGVIMTILMITLIKMYKKRNSAE